MGSNIKFLCFFILLISLGFTGGFLFAEGDAPVLLFSGSPYPERSKKDEKRAYTGQLPYHMMLYEKSEEEAEDQYSTIVKPSEEENSEPKQNTGEEDKIKGIPE